MKVKIPARVQIGAYEYDVRYRKDLVKHAHSTGQAYTKDAKIWIDPDELKQIKNVTFFHELIHCIGDVERINFEEGDIDRLAQCLVRILRDDFGIDFDWSDIKEVKYRSL